MIVFLFFFSFMCTVNTISEKTNSRVIIVSKAQHFKKNWHFPLSLGSLFTSVRESLVHRWLVHEPKVDSFSWLHQWQLSFLHKNFHQARAVSFHLTNASPRSCASAPVKAGAGYFLSVQGADYFSFGSTVIGNYILGHISQYLYSKK